LPRGKKEDASLDEGEEGSPPKASNFYSSKGAFRSGGGEYPQRKRKEQSRRGSQNIKPYILMIDETEEEKKITAKGGKGKLEAVECSRSSKRDTRCLGQGSIVRRAATKVYFRIGGRRKSRKGARERDEIRRGEEL